VTFFSALLALAERFEQRYFSAELHCLRGVFLAAMPAEEIQIEASFCEAIRIAREQKSISLSFALSRCNFWRLKARSRTKFLKLGAQTTFVTGGRSKPSQPQRIKTAKERAQTNADNQRRSNLATRR
jgi:hypothetical protein